MVTKVKIINRKNTPVRYLNSDGNHILTNGSEYEFKSGMEVTDGWTISELLDMHSNQTTHPLGGGITR